jgi:hypothetical protein
VRTLARLIAILGLVCIVIGAFVPLVCFDGQTCNFSDDVDTLTQGKRVDGSLIIDFDAYDDDAQIWYSINLFGLIFIALAIISLIPAVAARPAALYTAATVFAAWILANFVLSLANRDQGLEFDYAWGWGVLIGGILLLYIAGFIANIALRRAEYGYYDEYYDEQGYYDQQPMMAPGYGYQGGYGQPPPYPQQPMQGGYGVPPYGAPPPGYGPPPAYGMPPQYGQPPQQDNYEVPPTMPGGTYPHSSGSWRRPRR